MPNWSQVCEARTVHAGATAGPVWCGLMDTLLADLPVSLVFLYRQPLDADRLAEGLAVALRHVPVFAGRLHTVGGRLEIGCEDAGVPLTVTDLDEPLADVVGRVTLPSSGFVEHVDAAGARTGGAPLLRVQLTRLAGGATAVGCSFHHAVGDMQTFMLFMRAWSAAVEGAALPDVSIVEDRDGYLDRVLPRCDSGRPGLRLPDPAEAAALRREVETALRVNRTIQVHLGVPEVQRMRREYDTAAGRRLSTGSVLCAHLITTLRHLDGDPLPRHAALSVNLRRRLGLPAGLVGNVLGEIYLPYPPGSPPPALASTIREAVDDFPRAHLNFRANRAFLDEVGWERLGDCASIGFDPPRKTLALSSWVGFGVYDIAFQGQRPAFFSIAATVALPWVSWLVEGFGGSGYLFTASLPSRLAARLRGPDGYAALHRHREPGDPVPPLAAGYRKLG
jgi:hypothetical protein